MLIRVLVVIAALAAVPCVGAGAEEPVVFQLDETNLSVNELDRLSANLSVLEKLLHDPALGPQRKFGQNGWTHYSFALFSSGSLADRGYPVYLAADSQFVWVLVGVAAGNRTVWIPVEPTPERGVTQATLGRIPFIQSSGASLRVEKHYLSFDSVSSPPTNLSPVARFRASGDLIDAGDEVDATAGRTLRLTASPSHDPDGSIALYRWCVGESPCDVTTYSNYIMRPDKLGTTTITLVVVDNGGRSASLSATVNVLAPPPPKPDNDDGGCGCG